MTLQQKLVQADDYLDILKDKAKETDKLAKENLRLRKKLDTAINVLRKSDRKIERLKEEVERKNNIMKKAIEFIKTYTYRDDDGFYAIEDNSSQLITILECGVDKE